MDNPVVYRRLVYRCNNKFKKNHIKCETPTLIERL